MKKLVILLFLILSSQLYAQNYNNAAGLRAGIMSGISGKHFLNDKNAVEAIIGWRWGGTTVTGLYEIHQLAFDVDRLNWYYGGGIHAGFYESKYWYARSDRFRYVSYVNYNFGIIGVDGVIGIEYSIKEIPLTISLDYKPAISFGRHTVFQADEFAASARYMIN